MSIKPVLSFRGIFVGAIVVIMLGMAAFAFGERSYSSTLTRLFSAEAAATGLSSVNDGAKAVTSRTGERQSDLGGANGRLVFGRFTADATPQLTGRIGTVEPSAGSTAMTLTSEHEYEPAWSPDGKKIVFISMRDGIDYDWGTEERTNREIYIMNADGTDQRRLTFNLSPEAQPVFSPDGTKIIYVGMVNGDVYGNSGVFSMNIDGSNQTLLVNQNCISGLRPTSEKKAQKLTGSTNFYPGVIGIDTPNYSPDMSNIIFSTGSGASRGVYRHQVGGVGCSLVAHIGANSIEPRYSPDGTKIAVNGQNFSFEVRDVAGNLVSGYNPPGYEDYSTPTWSPDGTKIAYLGDMGDWGPTTIRTFDLTTQTSEIVYPAAAGYFYNGLSWGTPTNLVPSITLALTPYSVSGGQSVQGTIQMDPATFPAGGGTVDLSIVGNASVLTLPQTTVTIPPGSTSGTFTINTLAQINYSSADVVASYESSQARATVTVRPPKPDLSVTNVTVPANVTFGTAFNVSYTIQNASTSSTVFGYRDEIFFSRDNVWDAADSLLTTVNNSALAGSAQRTLTRSVTINATHNPENGQNYIIVVTNRNRAIDEGGAYANNALAQSFQMPLADLVSENLVIPAQSEPAVPYTLTWTLRNQGSRTTSTSFTSAVYFSSDNVSGNADDLLLSTINNSTLAAGASVPQSRSVTVPTVPVTPTGSSFFYVKVDSGSVISEGFSSGETNNLNFQPTQFDYLVPDLQVTASGVAADIDTDTVFPFSWTIANAGNKAAGTFSDRVYLSTDNQVGSDTILGTFSLAGGLGAGASVDRIQNFTITTGSIPASGTYFLYVLTDSTSVVNEGVNENNNTRFQPVYLRRAFRPDLTITNVTGPPTVFFDQTIQVQWTVTNGGAGPTNAPQWSDNLYIGTSPTSLSGATLLRTTQSVSALNPGESYTASAIVKVPRGFNGAYHFVVRTDSGGNLNEENTANNISSSPVQVNVPPLPDLIVESVQSIDQVFAGQEISINYTIRNIGTAEAGYHRERIYFSRDTNLSTSQDRLIFTSDGDYGPQAGQAVSYVSRNRIGNEIPPVYQTVRVPSNMEGLWYVFVVADYRNDTYEFTAENNNINYDSAEPGSPINVLVTPPDLVVQTQPTAPTTVATRQSFPVDFTVRNQGAFNAAGNLYHAVYLSTDQIFNAGSDTLLGTFKDPNAFGPGNEHPMSISVSLQSCLPNGTYYLFAVADYDNRQFEFDPGFDAELNNASPAKTLEVVTVPPDLQVTNFQISTITTPGQSATVSWSVANVGGPAVGNWIDRIRLISANPQIPAQTLASAEHTGGLAGGGSYSDSRSVILPAYMEGDYYLTITTDASTVVPECGTAESNNSSQSSTFTVQNNLPDLVIDSITAPTSATVGDSFLVQWAGRNANQAMPANSPTWLDYVYLSTDANLGGGDIYVGASLNSAILAGGQTYLQQTTINIGNVTPGTYYLLAVADGNRSIYEGTSGSVYESNNVRASASITLTAPAVDLTVGNVTVSLPHHSGTFRNISWTVTNNGSTPTLASTWTDYVILSRDSVLDPTDTTLGYRQRTGVLAGGANYLQTSNFYIPAGLTGDYSVFVITDRNNSVVENNNSNNTSAPLAINLTLPPPAELSITSITPPANINLGGNATFVWTVQNTGSNPVSGQWRDTVYLSRDQFWDASDVLAGIRDFDSQFTSVPASGGTYTSTTSFQVPPIEEGTYYVIVRTDAQNRIRESNEANNVATSVGTTSVTIQQLTLNTPFNTTLGNGASVFFKYVTTPSETLIFSLDTDLPQRANEAFTNFGTIVSRADYDYQSSRPGEGDQENFIPDTQEGNYYSMVRTDFIPESFASSLHPETRDAKAENTQPNGNAVAPQNITVNAQILPFSVRSVSPEIAGNTGFSTLLITGAKFADGANVKLVASNKAVITPLMTRVSTAKIAAIFDLKDKAAGDYDVVVTNPGGAVAALNGGLEIIAGGGHSLSESTLGPRGYRAGQGGRFRYTLSARNDGVSDALNVPFIIDIPQIGYELDRRNILDLPASALPPGTVLPLPTHYDFGDRRIIILMIPILRARTSMNFGIDLLVPSSLNSFIVNSVTLPPLAEIFASGLTQAAGRANRAALRAPALSASEACWAEFTRMAAFAIFNEILGSLGGIDDCAKIAFGLLTTVSDAISGAVLGQMTGGSTDGVGAAFSFAGVMANFISRIGDFPTLVNCVQTAENSFPPWKVASIMLTVTQLLYQMYQCLKPIGIGYAVQGLTSFDPNEKIGPEGYGGERFVPVRQPMLYRINFENLSTASAPAQRVFITDELPPTLDPRTVRLKEIGFKQNRIIVDENQSLYQARIQLGEDLNNLQADILAGLDIVNRRVFWTLQAIDPQTGEAPSDLLLGLLPPNNANGDGNGYVIFTIEPTATMPTGTELRNNATIYFDTNEPIVTNATANTLDSGVPTSVMSPLPSTSGVPSFGIDWSGSDDPTGSGLKGYDILFSESGEAYSPFLLNSTDTSADFLGKWGKTYRLYSVARDNAGNVELAPSQPDATITILGGDTEADVAPRPNGSDGGVNGDDLAQVRRFAAKLDTVFAYNELQRADSAPRNDGGNGALTVADVMQAGRFAAGLDPIPEALGPNEPAPFAIKTVAGKKSAMLPREIRAERITRIGDQLHVAVRLEAQGDETGVGFGLNFDPAVLSGPVATLGADGGGATLTLNNAQIAAGKLGVLIDKAPGSPFAAGSKHVLTLVFTVAPGATAPTQITFGNDPVVAEVVDGLAASLTTTFSPSTISLLQPTSAGVNVSGTVFKHNGTPLRNARATITDSTGTSRSALTNGFGLFMFEDIAAGQSYTISVRAKGYVFAPRLIDVGDEISGLEFLPEP